jgi:hypothetical protein
MPTPPELLKRWRDQSKARYAADPQGKLARQHARGIPCRGCGAPRVVSPKDRARIEAAGGPLCHDCRRAERDRLAAVEAEIREVRIGAPPAFRLPRSRRKGSGRSGTGNARYRRNRAIVLAASDVCGICGHSGAATADHITPDKWWPRDAYGVRLPGFDDVTNLQPSHGTMGRTGRVNRCPVCGKLCNQVKSTRTMSVSRPQRETRP